jgi:hypothetical protein
MKSEEENAYSEAAGPMIVFDIRFAALAVGRTLIIIVRWIEESCDGERIRCGPYNASMS